MKNLHFFSLWLIPAVLTWWGIRHAEDASSFMPACPPIACKDTVHVRLDEQCRLTLLPAMVLAGEFADTCLAKLQVEVFNPQGQSLGNTILAEYAGMYLKYVLTDPANNNSCWGHVLVEDKTPPALVCPEDTDWILNTAYANILTGAITTSDPVFRRSNFTCWLSAQTPEPGNYYYDTLSFQVTKDGVYTFVLLHDFIKSDIAAGAIFQGDFYAENPCQNIIAFTENRNMVTNGYVLGDLVVQQQIPWLTPQVPPFLRLELPLKKGQNYFLVTTSLKPEDTGNYAWLVLRDEITQPPGTEILKGKPVFELPWITTLVCDDFDRLKLPANACYKTDVQGNILTISPDLRRILQLTGFPHPGKPRFTRGASVKDNCGDISVCVADQTRLSYGTCDSTVIERTFVATDAKGNGTLCTQKITVRKPRIQDVILPTYANYIECDEQFPVDSTGYASPRVTGYPLVRTGFGIRDLDKPYCTLGATYVNKGRVDLCDRAYTFLREWTIYDWCNPGSTLIYTQLIKVGDFTPPTIGQLPRDPWDCIPTFSTGPFGCFASITIPEPDTIFDNCSGWRVTVDILGGDPPITLVAGKKPGDLVNNLSKGLYTFRYRLEDDCKNVVFREFLFEVLDLNEPMATCNDFLNVSLSSQGVGLTSRIFAKNLDEGSFDDCTQVGLKTRRVFADTACANSYVQIYFNKTFRELFFKKDADLSPYGLFYHTKVDAYFSENPDPAANPTAQNARPVFTLENGVLYSLLKDHVDVLCCDVQDSIRVELWVFDDANGNGTPGDTAQNVGYCRRTQLDNYNICWLRILIEDKAPPACKPPVDLSVLCTDERIRYQDVFTCADSTLLNEWFGKFIATDNCTARILCDTVIDTRNNCGVGTIIRRAHAMDEWGNRSDICEQRITVTNANEYIIGFPADKLGICSQIRDTTIYLSENACDLLAVNVIDKVLASDEACYKVERTFSVINWCEYDGQSDPYVISRDVDGDGKPGDEDIWVIRRPTRVFLDRAGTAAGNWVQNLPKFDTTGQVILPSETDGIPGANAEETRTPPTDEFPEAPWNGSNPRGAWDWADFNVDLVNGLPVIRRAGTNDDNSNAKDKLYAPGQRPTPPGELTNYPTGYWRYTQVLKITDTIPPVVIASPSNVVCTNADSCNAEVVIPFLVDEDCSFESVRFEVVIDYFNDSVGSVNVIGPRIRGQYPKYRYEDNFPIGEHTVEIRVKDGCGNQNSTRVPIRVADCKAPVPVCINGLAAELMTVRPAQDVNGDSIPDAGAVEIWATDFIASPNEDCSGPVTYSVSRLGEVPSRNQKSVLFTCADAGNSVPVVVYAWDNANNPRSVQPDGTRGGANYGSCITYVLVQDNLLNCVSPDSVRVPITGKIATEYDVPVPGVDVSLQNGASQFTQTTAQGFYGVAADVSNGKNQLKITPELDRNHSEGISTFDIVLISKHILGSQLLDSPYKLIAADVNKSRSVTVLDAIQLRKIILGVDVQFPLNKSWRFVDKHFQFPNPQNPWEAAFPEAMLLDADTLRSKSNADFVAIKIGDVSTQPTRELRNYHSADFIIQTADQVLELFKTYQVDFVADVTATAAYQFTLQFDKAALELTDVQYGLAQAEHFGWHLEQGLIATSWNAEATGRQTLFTLTFQSKTAGRLRDHLSVQSRPTLAEAYDLEGFTKSIQLSFDGHLTLPKSFTLYQNKPNPFSDVTTIGFHLPEAATARLQIFSADGRLLKNELNYYSSGYQEIHISKQDLRGIGLYYYTLEVSGFKETRKMIFY